MGNYSLIYERGTTSAETISNANRNITERSQEACLQKMALPRAPAQRSDNRVSAKDGDMIVQYERNCTLSRCGSLDSWEECDKVNPS